MNEISTKEFNSLIMRWGMYRRDHSTYVYSLGGGNYLTWTDMGGDIRHVYEKYGEWMLNIELQKTYRDFDDFFWTDVEEHMVQIKDIILSRIENVPGIFNKEAYANTLSAKIVKSVAFGATWLQMDTFIRKEIMKSNGQL